jgi:hypothetical protein
MRPYQLGPDGEWVDLDTVQSIAPPFFVDEMGRGGFFVAMQWRHAFQDGPREIRWTQPWSYKDRNDVNERPTPNKTEDGTPTEVERMHRELFQPFLNAWANPPGRVY